MEASLSFYQNSLQERVESTECRNDLIAILQLIPLNHIKHFISQQINELDLNFCRKLYHTQTSIDELFPSDIIQYILSFGGLYHTKAVSKKWKQYSEQNERNHLKKLYASINEIESPVQYDQNMNKTYIIDQNRTKLHKIETEWGYKGPMKDIEKTLNICNSGDRVLVHSGVYNVSHIDRSDLNVQLIGVGAAVTFQLSRLWTSFWYMGNDTAITSKCDIRNIKFFCSGQDVGFFLDKNATLWMENCEVITFSEYCLGVWAMYGSNLTVKNCKFIVNGSETLDRNRGIEISPFAKEVNIIDCTFESCGIKIIDQYDERGNDEMLQLKCVGNIFDIRRNLLDNFHPITETAFRHDNYFANSDRYMLRDNLLKGTSEKDEGNPNKIKVI